MTLGRAPGRAYLAASMLGAVNSLNAYRPLARTGLGTLGAFACGVGTEECPLQVLASQVIATAAFARKGALGTRAGKLSLAVNVASWIALVGLHAEAGRAGDIVENALAAGLAEEDRSRLAPVGAPPAWAALSMGQITLAERRHWRRYRAQRDVAYGDAGRRNLLDVWRRPDLPDNGRAPVLIQVPGGAWIIGSKAGQAYPLLAHMAERGWVCVAINYRLSPRATWPDQIVDVKRAIAWVKANIAEYGGDPSFVAITGGSAGGHLSALAALSINDPRFQPGFADADTTVQAAVPFYGVYDFTDSSRADLARLLRVAVMKSELPDDRDRWTAASPLHRVRPDAPPFFVIHGHNDSLVPVEDARRFVAALRQQSAGSVVFAELPLAQHAFDWFGSVRTAHVVTAVERFLRLVYDDAHGEAARR